MLFLGPRRIDDWQTGQCYTLMNSINIIMEYVFSWRVCLLADAHNLFCLRDIVNDYFADGPEMQRHSCARETMAHSAWKNVAVALGPSRRLFRR